MDGRLAGWMNGRIEDGGKAGLLLVVDIMIIGSKESKKQKSKISRSPKIEKGMDWFLDPSILENVCVSVYVAPATTFAFKTCRHFQAGAAAAHQTPPVR